MLHTIGLGAMIPRETKKMKSPKTFNRIAIYVNHQQAQLAKIASELQLASDKIATIASDQSPLPYPFTKFDDPKYHQSKTALCVNAALLKLHQDMKKLSYLEWQHLADHYLDIPKDSLPTGLQDVETISFTHDMERLSNQIAEHFGGLDIHMPYLKSRHGTAHKIIAAMAIEYSALQIK